MQHADTKPLLAGIPGQQFLDAHLLMTRRWHLERVRVPVSFAYRVYEEYPLLRAETTSRRHPQCDAMLAVSLFPGPCYYKDIQHILVEIKQERKDLMKFDVHKYNGAADFYYLAVVPGLLDLAMQKVADNPIVGVFDITTGRIYRLATYCGSADLTVHNLYEQLGHYVKNAPIAMKYFLAGPTFNFFKSECDDLDKDIIKKIYSFRTDFCEMSKDMCKDDALRAYYDYLDEFLIDRIHTPISDPFLANADI